MAERDNSREASGALAALLELEADIARRAARARESSELIVAEASAAADRASARRPGELREALTAFDTKLENQHRAELAAIEERARREAERYDAADDEAIASLADRLAEALMTLIVPEEEAR